MASVILSIILITCFSQLHADPVVQTSQGLVKGTILETRKGRKIQSFMGIPYAEPPTDNLRFRSPIPKKPWRGIFKATENGSPCPQMAGNRITGSEDCLSLNVYTPRLPAPQTVPANNDLLPVMVYIHGGGYTEGSSSVNETGPGYLLDKDIILVTLNYRLGIFGFISTGDDAAPGNYGLKDQRLALRWVQKNIRSFGGDPRRVTLVGESAGGSSVNLHALSKSSKDLFQQYIIQSGSVLGTILFRSDPGYYQNPRKLASAYKCPTDNSFVIINCLRGISTAKLVNSSFIFDDVQRLLYMSWGPVAEEPSEDAFVTDTPARLIEKNELKDAPFMIGNVRDEGLVATTVAYISEKMYELLTKNFTASTTLLLEQFDQTKNKNLTELSAKVIDFYFGTSNPQNKTQVLQGFTDMVSDGSFLYPTIELVNHSACSNKSPEYFYIFDYIGYMSQTSKVTGSEAKIGVAHADDLIYLFPMDPTNFNLPANITLSENDHKIVDIMVDLWTSFVSDGSPSSQHLSDPNIWKPYSQNESYLQIGDETKISVSLKHSLNKKSMEFWDQLTGADRIFCS